MDMLIDETARATAWDDRQRFSNSDRLRRELSERAYEYNVPEDFQITDSRAKGRISSLAASQYVQRCAYDRHCPEELKQEASVSADGKLGGYGMAHIPESFKRPRNGMVSEMASMTAERMDLLEQIDQSAPVPNIQPVCYAKTQCMREHRGLGVFPVSSREERYAPLNASFQ